MLLARVPVLPGLLPLVCGSTLHPTLPATCISAAMPNLGLPPLLQQPLGINWGACCRHCRSCPALLWGLGEEGSCAPAPCTWSNVTPLEHHFWGVSASPFHGTSMVNCKHHGHLLQHPHMPLCGPHTADCFPGPALECLAPAWCEDGLTALNSKIFQNFCNALCAWVSGLLCPPQHCCIDTGAQVWCQLGGLYLLWGVGG